MKIIRKYIVVKGIVQGVGFRPFVYKSAINNNLNGYVNNSSKGVFIDVQGYEIDTNNFIDDIKYKSPILSQVNEIIVEERSICNYKNFKIKESEESKDEITLISPDIAVCNECIKDISENTNKRYKYPFTNCTNCGPRFSIIKKLPYDRPFTTMNEFKMCDDCKKEYKNPLNRRFHAQPNGCSKCGPSVYLIDNNGKTIGTNDPVKEAIDFIKKGNILGVKGIGGFHLCCNGKDYDVINKLRIRKNRPTKPLALMMKDVKTVKKYCYVNEKEEEILTGNKKPILLLNKKDKGLPYNISPHNNKLGVMLPYTPLHHLLLEDLDVLVMTSANVSGLPIIYKNEEAIKKLNNIVDYLLIHNRDINIPVDDSVSRVVLGEERIIRNSRGYSPISMNIDLKSEILSCGSNLKNTFSISKNKNIFISQYIGDIKNTETYYNFEYNLNHFKEIYNINPEVVAYDMHPNYWSNEFINKYNIKIPVQHHHAHIISCMVENEIDDNVIGLAFDGNGYGTDGNIWGGEFLICDYKNFRRVGHLNYINLPGGDSAIKEPWKTSISYLYKTYKEDIYNYIPENLNDKNIKPIISMIKNNINSPLTSSIGRLFDAVSSIIIYKDKISFEGEAAILLETIANKDENDKYNYGVDYINEKYIINTDKLIRGIINDLKNNVDIKNISMKFHNTIVDMSLFLCNKLHEKYNINKVVLSGGVFQNEILLENIYKKLKENGFDVFIHKKIPTNDSGISLGQIVIANNNI